MMLPRALTRLLSGRRRRANCLALYGPPGAQANLEGWYGYILSWFEALGHRPDKIGIGGEGDARESKLRSFEHGRRKLEAAGFAAVRSIELTASIPGATSVMTGWKMTATANLDYAVFALAYDDDIRRFDVAYLEDLARTMAGFCDAIDYEIGYARDYDLGPDLYPYAFSVGFGHDRAGRRETARISKWANAHSAAKERNTSVGRHLREVCPLNILSRVHLSQDIDGASLEAWIEASPERGVLKPLTYTLWA